MKYNQTKSELKQNQIQKTKFKRQEPCNSTGTSQCFLIQIFRVQTRQQPSSVPFISSFDPHLVAETKLLFKGGKLTLRGSSTRPASGVLSNGHQFESLQDHLPKETYCAYRGIRGQQGIICHSEINRGVRKLSQTPRV